jgi:hypothetical protein
MTLVFHFAYLHCSALAQIRLGLARVRKASQDPCQEGPGASLGGSASSTKPLIEPPSGPPADLEAKAAPARWRVFLAMKEVAN